MKLLILAFLLFSTTAFGYYSSYNSELECAEISGHNSVGISCVSKLSMERDRLQIKLLRLQIKELEAKMKKEEESSKPAIVEIKK